MTLRVVVADDEPPARRGIVARLATYPDVEIVEECGDGETALAAVRRLKPDLLFLDVQMPGMSGFEALDHLAISELPLIIFTTAHGEYALRAFDVHAIDYLLKPIDDRRFAEAVARARQMQALGALGAPPARFAVKRGNTVLFVPAADVDWIEGVGDYAGLHTAGRTHLLREPLHRQEQRLDATEFVLIHRSTIVAASTRNPRFPAAGQPGRRGQARQRDGASR